MARTSAGVSSPCLGLRLQERFVGIAEQPMADHRRRPIGHVRLADQDHHVERRELLLRDFRQLAVRDALVGRAEILADVGGEIVDLAIEQRLGHCAGRRRVGGEHAHLGRRADLFDDQLQRLRRQVRQVGVFPAFLHAGKRQLHAADVRHDLEAVLAQPVAQVAGHAIEQRIAGRQHDDAFVAGRFDLADDRVQIAADLDLFRFAAGGGGQRLPARRSALRPCPTNCRAPAVSPSRPSSPMPMI